MKKSINELKADLEIWEEVLKDYTEGTPEYEECLKAVNHVKEHIMKCELHMTLTWDNSKGQSLDPDLKLLE